jgi:hypothetical protein
VPVRDKEEPQDRLSCRRASDYRSSVTDDLNERPQTPGVHELEWAGTAARPPLGPDEAPSITRIRAALPVRLGARAWRHRYDAAAAAAALLRIGQRSGFAAYPRAVVVLSRSCLTAGSACGGGEAEPPSGNGVCAGARLPPGGADDADAPSNNRLIAR